MLERFGIAGVGLDNLEEVYNPIRSGLFSMSENRANLIQKGMTAHLAETLARRYILKSDSNQVFTLMDFFSSTSSHSEALNALH